MQQEEPVASARFLVVQFHESESRSAAVRIGNRPNADLRFLQLGAANRSFEMRDTGVELRPRLPFNGPKDFTGVETFATRAASVTLSQLLVPIALHPLTVADDRNFLKEIAGQPNVPEAIRSRLTALY